MIDGVVIDDSSMLSNPTTTFKTFKMIKTFKTSKTIGTFKILRTQDLSRFVVQISNRVRSDLNLPSNVSDSIIVKGNIDNSIISIETPKFLNPPSWNLPNDSILVVFKNQLILMCPPKAKDLSTAILST